MAYQHVLIGSGKFGLGFAAYLADSASLRSLVISRNPTEAGSRRRYTHLSQTKRYAIAYSDRRTPAALIESCDFSLADFLVPTDTSLTAFASPELALVTVAVPVGALASAASLLAHGFRHRLSKLKEKAHPVTVLACVNIWDNGPLLFKLVRKEAERLFPADKDLREFLGRQEANFPSCVVDRICDDIRVVKGVLTVRTESYASLIVSSPSTPAIDMLAERTRSVVMTTTDISAWSKAKYWGITGVQLMLAAEACFRASTESQQSGAWRKIRFAQLLKSDGIAALSKSFLSEISVAILLGHPAGIKKAELDNYFSSGIERLRHTQDTPQRILKDFRPSRAQWGGRMNSIAARLPASLALSPHERDRAIAQDFDRLFAYAFKDFLNKVNDRLVAPTLALSWHGITPLVLDQTLSFVLAMMAREAVYEPSSN